MLTKFVEKVNYISWFSGNSTKIFPQSSVERSSYIEMVKSRSFNLPATRPKKGTLAIFSIKKEIIKLPVILPPKITING